MNRRLQDKEPIPKHTAVQQLVSALQRTKSRKNRRIPRSIVKNHSFTRTMTVTIPISNPATGVLNFVSRGDNADGFRLSQLPNYTEFTYLFDQYKINRIDMTFFPSWIGSDKSGLSTKDVVLPTLVTVNDYDDSNALTTRSDYLQYESYRAALLDGSKILHRSFKPQVAMATFGSGVFTSYASPAQVPWIDANSAGVDFYGIKWAVIFPVAGDDTLSGYLTVDCKLHCEFRHTR